MSANLFMIYQINDLEKSRDYRCRPYEYQIENSFIRQYRSQRFCSPYTVISER